MSLEELIRAANNAYGDDLVLNSFEGVRGVADDTLADFIAKELEDTFEPEADRDEQFDEAITVLDDARRRIEDVISALIRLKQENQ